MHPSTGGAKTLEIFNIKNKTQNVNSHGPQKFIIFFGNKPIELLRPQSQTGKVCRERLPRFALGNLGKRSMERWERSAH